MSGLSDLLAGGLDLSAKNKQGVTPAQFAAEADHAAALEILLANGADAEAAMFAAVKNAKFKVSTMAPLLEAVGGFDVIDPSSKEPLLHVLASAWASAPEEEQELAEGELFGADAAAFLLDQGATVDIQNKNKENVIHVLASKEGPRLTEAVAFFKDRGADMEFRNKKGLTPLLAAATKGRADAIAALCATGACNLNRTDSKKQTALLLVIKSKKRSSLGAVQSLIDAGADVNRAPPDAFSPLQHASREGSTAKVAALIAGGADVNLMHGSEHAIHLACKKKRTEVVELLVDNGADLNEKDGDGKTPLFYAAEVNVKDIVKKLLKGGANINIRCNGESPLDIATGECERLIYAKVR